MVKKFNTPICPLKTREISHFIFPSYHIALYRDNGAKSNNNFGHLALQTGGPVSSRRNIFKFTLKARAKWHISSLSSPRISKARAHPLKKRYTQSSKETKKRDESVSATNGKNLFSRLPTHIERARDPAESGVNARRAKMPPTPRTRKIYSRASIWIELRKEL